MTKAWTGKSAIGNRKLKKRVKKLVNEVVDGLEQKHKDKFDKRRIRSLKARVVKASMKLAKE